MLKRIGIVSVFLCAYMLLMMHNLMPHSHEHHHVSKHHHHSDHDHHDNDTHHDSDNAIFDHSEAFGEAIVKSGDVLIVKTHIELPHIDDWFIQPQINGHLALESPPDKLYSRNQPYLQSSYLNSPKSLRAPPIPFLL